MSSGRSSKACLDHGLGGKSWNKIDRGTELDKEGVNGHAVMLPNPFRIGSDPYVAFMSLHTNNVGKNITYIVKSDVNSIWL